MKYLVFMFLIVMCIVLAMLCIKLIADKEMLEEEIDHAENRATTYFRRLHEIETILKESKDNNEMYYTTIDKIKRVIFINGAER